MKKPLGEKLSPILDEIALTLWESESVDSPLKPDYTIEGVAGGIKIFMSVMMDAMWNRQESEFLSIQDRKAEASELGESIRQLILKHTGIDTHKLYSE